jgi:hypothetical protein
MNYRKYKAEKIFDGYKIWSKHVLITDENGVVKEIVPENEADESSGNARQANR